MARVEGERGGFGGKPQKPLYSDKGKSRKVLARVMGNFPRGLLPHEYRDYGCDRFFAFCFVWAGFCWTVAEEAGSGVRT